MRREVHPCLRAYGFPRETNFISSCSLPRDVRISTRNEFHSTFSLPRGVRFSTRSEFHPVSSPTEVSDFSREATFTPPLSCFRCAQLSTRNEVLSLVSSKEGYGIVFNIICIRCTTLLPPFFFRNSRLYCKKLVIHL